MHNIAEFLHVSENLITMPLMFLIIAVSVINSLSLKADGLAWYLLLIANLIIICMAWGFELWNGRKRESTKIILYEKIENIKPGNKNRRPSDVYFCSLEL